MPRPSSAANWVNRSSCISKSSRASRLRPGQVRVAVRAAGLNYPDVLMVAGKYQHKPALPFVPGMEAAGDVVEVAPDVTDFAVGDRVMVRGGFTEEVIAAARDLKRMPRTFDYAQGATFLAGHGTAYYGLVDRAQHQSRRDAAGARRRRRRRSCRGRARQGLWRDGDRASPPATRSVPWQRRAAPTMCCRRASRSVSSVKELTDGRGADVVFDPVGGKVFEESSAASTGARASSSSASCRASAWRRPITC